MLIFWDTAKHARHELEIWRELFSSQARRSRKPQVVMVVFLIQRYFNLASIGVQFAYLWGPGSLDCQVMKGVIWSTYAVVATCVASLFAWRTIAVWNGNKYVAAALWTYVPVIFGIQLYVAVNYAMESYNSPDSVFGFHCGLQTNFSPIIRSAGFIASLGFDTLVCVLTLVRLFNLGIERDVPRRIAKSSVVYFAAALAVNLVMVILPWVCNFSLMAAAPVALSFAAANTIASHMFFSLRLANRKSIAENKPSAGSDGAVTPGGSSTSSSSGARTPVAVSTLDKHFAAAAAEADLERGYDVSEKESVHGRTPSR